MNFLLILASIANFNPILLQPDGIIGEWYTVEQRSTIKIQKTDMCYFGLVTSINKNVDNPNAQNLSDKKILKNLKYSDSKDVYEGQIYLPKYDEYTDCTIKLVDKKLQITIKIRFLNKTVEWIRKE